jgi:hypothetical protein
MDRYTSLKVTAYPPFVLDVGEARLQDLRAVGALLEGPESPVWLSITLILCE